MGTTFREFAYNFRYSKTPEKYPYVLCTYFQDIEICTSNGQVIVAKPDKKTPSIFSKKKAMRNLLEVIAVELRDVHQTLPNIMQFFTCDKEDADLSADLKHFCSTCKN